jgi:uncharacterized membrane protein YgaE (UPF0421/DUF939 family)
MGGVTTQTIAHRARHRIRLRGRLGSGVARIRTSWWSIGQSALGGALAWELAVRLFGHPAPFFAAVAAIVCLSISVLNRLRRVLELALGVTIGVVFGDLLVREIGRGGWQLGVVVLIAMTVGLLFDGGALIVNQAALQAVFVAALPPPTGGYLGRWQDALLGGVTALAIAFLLPADPRPAMRRQADAVTHAVAGALRACAAAARAADPEAAFAALESARATQPMLDSWTDAVRAAEEISRLSPLRRRADPEIAGHRRSLDAVDRAVRNLRVALRRALAAIEDDATAVAAADPRMEPPPSSLPPDLLDRFDELAGALHTLPGALLDPGGEGGRRAIAALVTLAGRLDPDQLAARSMSATVVLAQLRSAVIDLLQVPGVSQDDARDLLRREPPTGWPPPR